MKSKLLALALLAGSTMFAGARVSIGVGIGVPYGGYYAPPPAYVEAPPCPGPGYNWVDGYWDYEGPQRYWRAGYWAAPVYAPGYYGGGAGYYSSPDYYRGGYSGGRGYYGGGGGYYRGGEHERHEQHERYEHSYRDGGGDRGYRGGDRGYRGGGEHGHRH